MSGVSVQSTRLSGAEEALGAARREERRNFARKLYDVELMLGNVFHAVSNENDCESAGEQIETLLDHLHSLREEFES